MSTSVVIVRSAVGWFITKKNFEVVHVHNDIVEFLQDIFGLRVQVLYILR